MVNLTFDIVFHSCYVTQVVLLSILWGSTIDTSYLPLHMSMVLPHVLFLGSSSSWDNGPYVGHGFPPSSQLT